MPDCMSVRHNLASTHFTRCANYHRASTRRSSNPSAESDPVKARNLNG